MIAGMPAGGPPGSGEDHGDILARISAQLGAVDAKLAAIEGQEIPALEESGRENRRLINVLIAAAVVFAFVIVAVVAGFAYWNARQDSGQASRNAAAARAAAADARGNCMAANQRRAQDLVLEERVIRLLNGSRSDKARLSALVRVEDSPRKCP